MLTHVPRPKRAATSPLADALARVGDRWTLLIVAALLDGPKRFNELESELEGIAPNILSARLKALTEQALVVAQAYTEKPPRFVYELSESGRELAGALRLLADWGARTGGGEPYRHEICGTALEARWWCPTCEQVVDDPSDDELVHV
jgi:DNA-binding HxlR family transcriptional regulator